MSDAILISDMADNTDFRPLLEMFVAELPARMEKINNALASGDLETVREVAHQLKGAGGGYGYMPITEAAKAVEMSVKFAETEKTPGLVQELDSICKAAERGL